MADNSAKLVRAGVIGVTLAIAIVLATLRYDQLPFIRSGVVYTADFADAGGLAPGDRVEVAGIKSGQVEKIQLAGDRVRVQLVVDESIPLGVDTRLAIKTNTVLGRKSLAVSPAGPGAIDRDDTVPLERTESPYSLNDALGDLTTTVTELDTDRVNRSLTALSDALANTPAPLRSTLDGVTRLSQTLNNRDAALRELLAKAQSVTKVLADRGGQINSLLVDGNALLAELDYRRTAISELITNISSVSQQLSGLVRDNEEQLGPVLDKLNKVLDQLERNKTNLAQTLDGLGPYATALGEAVGSGPYFQAHVAYAAMPTIQALVDALVRPENLPKSLYDYLLNPPPSINPIPGGGVSPP